MADSGDDEEYTDDSASEDEDVKTSGKSKKRIDSSSEDEANSKNHAHSDPCAICLGNLCGLTGTPENCSHTFCLDCILEWAKTNNSCPQDRVNFLQVLVRKRAGGPVVRKIKVEQVDPVDIPPEAEDATVCEVW